MALVAGVDSSTQACKVVVRDAETGVLLRSGRAVHPAGTSVDPEEWWRALGAAVAAAGGLEDVSALSVAAQQHGMVALDAAGKVVRDALLWNDTRSAAAADALVAELEGGAAAWASAVGSVPLASFTVAKLRWLAEHEPDHARKTAAVCLPHDWLTWRLRGSPGIDELTTDRSDASGTGYWSATDGYRADLLRMALGAVPVVPTVKAPAQAVGTLPGGAILGPGAGDNAGAALGLDAAAGDVLISIGTSAVVSAVSDRPTADPTGEIAGFADATGRYLPLVCTLNGVGVLHAVARLLGVALDQLSRLALQASPGAEGLVVVPYFAGERTPNRPDASGALHGMTVDNVTPGNMARAAVEGLLCGLADGLDRLRLAGIPVTRLLLLGGGARSEAVRRLAPTVLGLPVEVPDPSETVADGAARQAAWVWSGADHPPAWKATASATYDAPFAPFVRERYAVVRDLTARRMPGD
jgi:xylulokinase